MPNVTGGVKTPPARGAMNTYAPSSARGEFCANLFAMMQPQDVYVGHGCGTSQGPAVSVMQVWPLAILSAAVAAGFLIGGASSLRQRRDVRTAMTRTAAAGKEAPTAIWSGADDTLEALIRAVLNAELAACTAQFTGLEMAVEPGLMLRWDRDALGTALHLILQDALGRAAGRRVLVTASRHGGRVQIVVSDDGDVRARDVQEAMLREPQQILALMGGTIDVDPQPGRGTRIALRLPDTGATARTQPLPAAVAGEPAGQSVAAVPALTSYRLG
ncbi:MAG TPA: hypothetical protein VFA03_03860 [Acetobacteraceae bacterium]|nr:hypothetical protein [Acetobacteraceae bacterium]